MSTQTPATEGKGFLARLLRNQAGNTIAMVGAALVPLTIMIGSGVDASRGYMVKARLQQACDAAALAGRKAVGDGTWNATTAARARTFFNSNFPSGYQGTTGTTFTPNSTDNGTTVTGTARTTLPTVIMGLFSGNFEGKDRLVAKNGNVLQTQSITLTATCSAVLNVSNSDVTMVLDTTGSMNCPNTYTVSQCASYDTTTESSTSRLKALKSAVTSFYNTLATASAGTTARIRYAMVPFSFTVNVGKLLYNANPAYLTGGSSTDTWTYQSRRARYKYISSYSTSNFNETLQYISAADCTGKFGSNTSTSSITYRSTTTGRTSNTWTPASSGYTYATNKWTKSTDAAGIYYIVNSASTTGSTAFRVCTRSVTKYTPVYSITYDSTVSGATLDTSQNYDYMPVAWPVYDYVRSINTANPAVKIPSNLASDTTTTRWAGCIEERSTTAAAPGSISFDASQERILPTTATDLDIDLAPTSAASTKWRPYWPEVTYYRLSGSTYTTATTSSGSKSQVACPAPAQLLQTMTSAQMTAYLNQLSATGGTHHDIGALWGARLSSEEGIFSTNVLAPPSNGSFVSRHLIFFTDGALDTGLSGYSSYAVEGHDRRITGSSANDATQDDRHITRFRAICDAIKAKGIRIWMVTLGQTINADMTYCASPNSSFSTSNQTQLTDAFVKIAQSIADLRLTQ